VPAVVERVARSLVGPDDESVERHGDVENSCGHGVSFPGLRRAESSRWNAAAAVRISNEDRSGRLSGSGSPATSLTTSGTTRPWDHLATRHVELARDVGALTVLPATLTHRVAVHLFAGEFDTAATGGVLPPYGALVLAAWRPPTTRTSWECPSGRHPNWSRRPVDAGESSRPPRRFNGSQRVRAQVKQTGAWGSRHARVHS
jgi:hypothetical protein